MSPGKAVTKKGKATSPEAERADRAHEVEERIKAGCDAIRQTWTALAAFLYEFSAEKMWADLGWESFEEWLGSPEISIGRSHVFALIKAYKELVVNLGIPQERIASIEATKIEVVLPAIRKGEVDPEKALADCESLSRLDLRKAYGKELSVERRSLVECSQCGLMRQPAE